MKNRLRHTYNTKKVMTESEEIYVAGWSIIDSEVTRLLDLAWKFQERGKQVAADKTNEAANYLIYLMHYAIFVRSFLDRQGLIDDGCTATAINDNFKIECIEKNLPCLSANLNTDFVSVWKELLSTFGITRQTAGCETECCLGIGEMEIGGLDDCTAFIIGPCEENINEENIGEYEDCAYDDAHAHGEATDACSEVDTNCN